MMNTPRNSSRPGTRTGMVLAIVACCAIARGDGRTAELRDLHQKQIAEKSESERARLQRVFREFRELPATEQARLRLFNDELKKDDQENGGLRGIMSQYHEWLATLTPGQREDLRQQTDPNVREKKVRELLKEQQEHAETTGSASGSRPPRGLSSDDLAAVLGVIEQALLSKQILSEEEKTLLQRKKGLAQHMYVMELACRRPGVLPGQQFWNSFKVGDALIAEITNPKQRNFVQSRERPEDRRWNLFSLIRGGLMSEYEKNKPSAGTLEEFFVQLPVDKQDEIMRLPFDRQQQKLTHMFLEKKSEDDPNNYPRPPRGFWMMQPPPGFRPPNRSWGQPQRGGEGDAVRRENGRKKMNNKNGPQRGKPANGPNDAPDKLDE